MRKKLSFLFVKLFPSKEKPEFQQPKPVIITSYSQPNILQHRMKEKKLTHGETVTANLSQVRLENAHEKMVMYFCPMKGIEILQTFTDGDGNSIPAEAKVEGLTIPGNLEEGFYNLRNVTLTSNGTMQVKATDTTYWEKVASIHY